jgi:predicted small secreted protein
MRKTILVTAAVAALSLGLAAPAFADTTGGTGASFDLTGGLMSITVPTTVAPLGTQATGVTPSISGPLGPVTVTDARGLLAATWTASATSTAFTTGAAGPAETIANTAVTYTPGLPTTTGTAVVTPGLGGPMTGSQTAYSAAATVGNNSTSWNPTISVAVPTQAVAGTYNATITHSVA